eukprot:1165553-Pleurochrysis_carterae.AAC.1
MPLSSKSTVVFLDEHAIQTRISGSMQVALRTKKERGRKSDTLRRSLTRRMPVSGQREWR